MTSLPKTATLSEHADRIKAAIKAAEDDGFKLEVDVTIWDNIAESVELDIWEGRTWINVWKG